jgi:hypothetical protein
MSVEIVSSVLDCLVSLNEIAGWEESTLAVVLDGPPSRDGFLQHKYRSFIRHTQLIRLHCCVLLCGYKVWKFV